MNIILCSKSCIYQEDGYCNIEISPLITGFTENGCIYFINKNSKSTPIKNSIINKIEKTT